MKLNSKQVLEKMVELYGWSWIMTELQDIAFDQDLPELYRELDNIVINYVPEVR